MSPRTKEAQKKVRDQSRSRIMEAGLKLFAEKGYHAASMDQLAKRAGVSKGLIYNYFENKEELLKKIIDEALSIGSDVALELENEHPKTAFISFIDYFFNLLKTQTDYLRLLMSLSIQVRSFDFVTEVTKNKTNMYDNYFRQLLQRLGFEGNDGEIIELESVFEGAATIYYVIGGDERLEKLKAHLIKKYCK